ncbi:unnamed protein product, partial [Leptidea sinapis]
VIFSVNGYFLSYWTVCHHQRRGTRPTEPAGLVQSERGSQTVEPHGPVGAQDTGRHRSPVFVMTLYPGDILLTGTPGGVGMYRSPPEYLKPGDVILSEIENIGVLETKVERFTCPC